VLLVVLDHAGVGFLQGGYVGVDVFFVLSGFLITGILLAGARKRGYVSLSDFYVRRARRILPAAVLTLIVTDLVAYYLLNFVRARQAVSDSIWASFFVANVHFAKQGTDYFAQGQPPSPIQHFWSLSVEEQFYLVWPGLLGLVLFGLVRSGRFGLRRRSASQAVTRAGTRRLLLAIVVLSTASLSWSVHQTKLTPPATYFSTAARVWELGLGAALAIGAGGLTRAPAALRIPMGWIGVACIGWAAVSYSDRTVFPGYAALLPTIGAALVIGAGISAAKSRFGVGRILGLRPFRYVGDRSYAYYLWHWPVLIIAVQYAGHDLSVGVMLLLALGAFGISVISYALFENPIRQMRWRAPAGALLWPASAAAVFITAVLILGAIDDKAARVEAAAAAVKPAALVDATGVYNARLDSKPLPAVMAAVKAAQRGDPLPSPLVPPVDKLLKDSWLFPSGCTPSDGETSSKICRFGDTAAAKTIVVIGDSHAQHWMPAILQMAQQDGWVVLPLVKSACTPHTWLRYSKKPECPGWYKWAIGQARALHPDVTLIAGSWYVDNYPDEAVKTIAALTPVAKRFSKSVIVVGDPPKLNRQPVDCLLAANATMKTCTTTVTKVQVRGDTKVGSIAKKRHVGFVDTRGWFCARLSAKKPLRCPLVVNRTITRRDPGHITVTYDLELVAPFRAAFRRALFGG
jgi:peptidoglycan/LPS O-acetylase OafA/YrhL